MKIACLGWGSLIWEPNELELEIENKEWFTDGPYLPIEFTRFSNHEKVTLIIDEEARPVQVLWNIMKSKDLMYVRENLKVREKTPTLDNIHYLISEENQTNKIHSIISEWAKLKKFDAVIWTGLSYSKKTNNKRPSLEDILSHLSSLTDEKLIEPKEYIINAPKQIETEYRKHIMSNLGW